MFHNNGVVTNLKNEPISKFENFPLNDNEGGVNGLNRTPCFVKPLMIKTLFFISRSCAPSMVNPNLNLGVQLGTFGNQGLLNLS
jgi:hypothetical protein